MSDGKPNDDAYEVGYKRPPRSSRFKPGQSGNPKGRRKGSRNFASAVEAELNTRISVTENGIRKIISKREATAKHLVNKAATGLLPAVKILLEQERQQELEQSTLSNAPRELLPPDHLVLKSLSLRLMQIQVTPATNETVEAPTLRQPIANTDTAEDEPSSVQQMADSRRESAEARADHRSGNTRNARSSANTSRKPAVIRTQEPTQKRFSLGCDPLYPPREESNDESN